MDVINCKQCNKVFRQRLHPICPECVQRKEENFTRLYRLLQDSASVGGISIHTLSSQLGISVEEIEQFYIDGCLSTAGLFLKMPCQACGVLSNERERKGRYCHKCSEITANQAGVEVKNRQDIKRQEELEQQRLEQASLFQKTSQKNQPSRPQPPQEEKPSYSFGFNVRR